jgi:hypothetical protein
MFPSPAQRQQGSIDQGSTITYDYSSPEQLAVRQSTSVLSNDAFNAAVAPLVTLLGNNRWWGLLVVATVPGPGQYPIQCRCLYPPGDAAVQQLQFAKLQQAVVNWLGETELSKNDLLLGWLGVLLDQLRPVPGDRRTPAAAVARLEELQVQFEGSDPELAAALSGI